MAVKTSKETEKVTKFQYIFKDDDCISIWKYDLSRTKGGPVSVENRYTASHNKMMEQLRIAKRKKRKTDKS
jgi:hypothetical protein